MLETLVPMKIPALTAHLTDVEIMYSTTKTMNFAPNGHHKGHLDIEKAQLIQFVEAILRPF